MKKHDWNRVSDVNEYERPTPGAYIAVIEGVKDFEDKEYLRIEYDFAEGQFKGHYADLYNAKAFWGGVLIKSYKEKALPFFKAFKTCLEESNPGYIFDEDRLGAMRGKIFGIVLGEEEYLKNDGTIGKRLYVAQTRSYDAIRKGDFTVPALKRLTAPTAPKPASGFQVDDDDGELPW